MLFTLLFSLFPLLIIGVPAPLAPSLNSLTAAATPLITCTTMEDGVRYRTSAHTSCTAMGQYPVGTQVTFTCITRGETINGNNFWVKDTSGYFSAATFFGSCTNGDALVGSGFGKCQRRGRNCKRNMTKRHRVIGIGYVAWDRKLILGSTLFILPFALTLHLEWGFVE
ncbi:hypothetical protein K440DRAFT_642160 [Wilcoxina mikolae CBS 423.85]|nr:hypothetical protein K440DRAFT_642160 [Wilcoxina mikolae CBS 423.85]